MSPTLIRSLRGQLCVMALSALSCGHGAQQELATAVACPPAAALDDTWQPRDLGSFHLRLPPGFEQGKRLECEHGGVYFARDTERVGWCMIMFETVRPREPILSIRSAFSVRQRAWHAAMTREATGRFTSAH